MPDFSAAATDQLGHNLKGAIDVVGGKPAGDIEGQAPQPAQANPAAAQAVANTAGPFDYQKTYQLLLQAGATPQEASILAAIAGPESSYNPSEVSKPNSNGTVDRGLFQINSVHTQFDPVALVNDPLYNAKAALEILHQQGFDAWTTYKNGAYKKYMQGGMGDVASPSSIVSDAANTQPTNGAPVTNTPTPQATEGGRLSEVADAIGQPVTTAQQTQQQTFQKVATQTVQQGGGPAQAAVKAAMTAVGQPYVWGGNDLGSGVDCSGLIQQAYKAAGIDLPRVSNDQARAGTPVPVDQMQPGDILWWDYGGSLQGADHVAMYLGNGKMIEALHTGLPVHIVDVRKPDGVTRPGGGGTQAVTAASTTNTLQPVPPDTLGHRMASIASALSGSINASVAGPTV